VDGKVLWSYEQARQTLTERDALIPQIRGFPGLENFSSPLSFDKFHSAASHGPVIIINHCELGSDIIIVRHDSPPSRVPTPSDFQLADFFDRARLLKARNNHDLNSKEHDTLSPVC
jgi:hypothetical protein